MHQLIYISTGTREISPADIDGILAASRRKNERAGISGLLLYDGRRFLQALEGEEAQTGATFERIKADDRHRAIVMLSSREIAARQFGDWAMAWHRVDPVSGGRSLSEIVDALVADVTDANTRELFRGFARIERREIPPRGHFSPARIAKLDREDQ